ncbi:MAG: hypothetical protein ACPLF9_05640 [Methanothermobacter tenebrarum]
MQLKISLELPITPHLGQPITYMAGIKADVVVCSEILKTNI